MSKLNDFERRLEGLISGLFARTFKSSVQPVEIVSQLNRELDTNAQSLSRDRRIVPNSFSVELSPSDYASLDALGSGLKRELTEMMREHAAGQSYVFSGPISIDLVEADDVRTGVFRVHSDTKSDVKNAAGDPTDTSVRRAHASLEINGQRHPLFPPGIVLGRGNDATLRIDDPGVSRRHAEIKVVDTGFGARVSVHDLGSTNGISVNGKKTDQATLTDGAVIRMGNTELVLHMTDGSTGV